MIYNYLTIGNITIERFGFEGKLEDMKENLVNLS